MAWRVGTDRLTSVTASLTGGEGDPHDMALRLAGSPCPLPMHVAVCVPRGLSLLGSQLMPTGYKEADSAR